MKFADVGCGYGGLLLTLSEMFPNDFSVGFEIRIKALRQQNEDKKYNNIACMRLNAMKYLPNLFYKGQVR